MLHICPDIVHLLGDENVDLGTIRLDCSDATIATSKIVPFKIINYLEPSPLLPLLNPAPSTVPYSTTTSKKDATDSSLPPATTSSTEGALNNRSEESKVY